MTLTPKPLKWDPPMYFLKGERVEYMAAYGYRDINNRLHGKRGTVLIDAPNSLTTGVTVDWGDGDTETVRCFQVRKLGLLDLLGEV